MRAGRCGKYFGLRRRQDQNHGQNLWLYIFSTSDEIKKMRWAGHVARSGGKMNSYSLLATYEGRNQVGRLRACTER